MALAALKQGNDAAAYSTDPDDDIFSESDLPLILESTSLWNDDWTLIEHALCAISTIHRKDNTRIDPSQADTTQSAQSGLAESILKLVAAALTAREGHNPHCACVSLSTPSPSNPRTLTPRLHTLALSGSLTCAHNTTMSLLEAAISCINEDPSPHLISSLNINPHPKSDPVGRQICFK